MTSRGRPATRRVGPFVRMPERMAEVGIDPEPVLRGLSFGSKARVDCDGWPPFQAGLLAPGRAAGLAESGLSLACATTAAAWGADLASVAARLDLPARPLDRHLADGGRELPRRTRRDPVCSGA